MTTYTFTRGRQGHEHGAAGKNNTPALRDYDVLMQTALTSLGTDVTALQDIALDGGTLDLRVDALDGYGKLVFAKGITAEDNSTGVTAGTTETGFTNYVTIPANTLAANDRIRITAVVKATNANSTDTLALKLNVSTTTDLKTTAFTAAATAAADSTANDIFHFTADLRVVAIGAAATAKFNGVGNAILAGGATWQNATSVDDVTTVATNAAIYVGLTYTYSASHADNVSRIKECFVSVTRPSA